MKIKTKILSLSMLALLTACSSNQPEESTSIGKIPSWVLSPEVEDGIAVSECVLYSGSLSIDKQQAVANARASLAQRIETKVSVMDKSYKDKVTIDSNVQTGSTFSSVSKQISSQTLRGTNPMKVDIININEKDNLCVLVAVGQESTKALFDNLVNASGRKMSPKQKDILYQEFKAQKAEDQLDAELEK